jgi:hypothetical protein
VSFTGRQPSLRRKSSWYPDDMTMGGRQIEEKNLCSCPQKTGRSGDRIPVPSRFTVPSKPTSRLIQPAVQEVTGLYPGVKGRSVVLSTHLFPSKSFERGWTCNSVCPSLSWGELSTQNRTMISLLYCLQQLSA